MAIKLICGSFLVVVLLGYLAEAKTIIPPPQSPPTQRQKNQNNPISQNPYNPQVPGQTQIPHDEEFYSCEVVESQRIGCGETGISQSECERINCCYGPRGCFFGKAGEYSNRASSLRSYWRLMGNVSNWHLLCHLLSSATLHCNANGDIILVVARDATVPSIEVNSISLMGDDNPSCSPHVSTAFIVYKFNANQCGTQVTVRIAASVWLSFIEFWRAVFVVSLVLCLFVLGRGRWCFSLSKQTVLHFRDCNWWKRSHHEGHRFWVCIFFYLV